MELVVWDGGLHQQEIEALKAMEIAFSAKPEKSDTKQPLQGGSLASQLGQAFGRPVDSIFPWKGYAGFRFVDSRGNEGEFDLLLITHERVIIVELKELKGKKVTYDADKWYCDGYEKYRSPVSVTQNKVYLIKDKLDKVRHKFKRNRVPWIEFLVILSNDNDYSSLPDHQKKHVMGISEFLELADESKYNKRFAVRGSNHELNSQFSVFDDLISGDNVKPKHLSVQNYITTVDDLIFPLPGQESVYKEFIATSEANRNDKALLRQWDFSKIGDLDTGTPEGRYRVISHERDVLVEIKNQIPDLYRYCLQPKTNPTSDEVTRQFHELYDLPADNKRFNEYINNYVEKFDEQERVTLVQVLLQQFSGLHLVNIAHRDIGEHSLWLSPSKKISLSSFISAYYQPLGTVGPRREKLSVGVIPIPEDYGNADSRELSTPFHRDVYALGVISQLILSGSRVSLENISCAISEIEKSEKWYGDILRKAISKNPTDRFGNAGQFRDAIISAKPSTTEYVLHNESQLDPYRKGNNPYKTYPEDEVISDKEGKEIYLSGDLVVRLWSDVNPSVDQPQLFQACLNFLEKASRLVDLNSKYLASINEFGVSLKTSQLYLIQEYVEGPNLTQWLESDPILEERKEVIDQLIRGVEYLHNVDVPHGDIHPGNVIVCRESDDISIRFIDYLDFCKSGQRIKNHRYSPPNVDGATDASCDNFAVMRLSAEILGIDWDGLNGGFDREYPELVSALKQERNGSGSYLSLDRMKQSLDQDFSEASAANIISITIRSDDCRNEACIFPDNDELFIHIEEAKKPGEIKVHVSGVGGSINFFYSPEQYITNGNTPFNDADTANLWERKNSQLVINSQLRVTFDNFSDYSELDEFLATLDGFHQITSSVISHPEESVPEGRDSIVGSEYPHSSDAGGASSSLPDENFQEKRTSTGREILTLSKGNKNIELDIKARPKSQQIWKSMIETEVDALPTIILTEKPDYSCMPGFVRLSYSSSENFLDNFTLDEEVELLRKVDDKLYGCGKLDIKESNHKFIFVKHFSSKTKFNIDDVFHLRTNSQRSSYVRRKRAVDRILDRTSVIPDLVDYFGECGADKALKFSNSPTDEDFAVYDRDDGHGNVISLNERQRQAFTKLVTTGPVSLLQGPPGTGKTEFIAAFTHYLISRMGVNHILLVSQSHEAVNTAAERIRQHCSAHNTELDVVRFSNKSSNISAGLLDAYSTYLVEAHLEEFRAQFAERLFGLQGALGLPRNFLEAVVDKEFGLNKRLRVLKQFTLDIQSMNGEGQEKDRLCELANTIRSQIEDFCSEKYGVLIENKSSDEISNLVDNVICANFGIAPNESKRIKLMMSLMNDYQERLDTSPGSYEEFLARSRTLVCGTCVGIGLGHLSVRENQYDWVIIDEAARSVSSELAIAMQSGKRVLLVGDHKQLPPTYQDEHKSELSRRLKINKNDPDFDWVLKSDFERAFESDYGKAAGAKLLIQYRMIEPIGNMVSDVFYDSELKTGNRHVPDIYSNISETLEAPVTWLDISPLGNSSRSQVDKNHSSFNSEEADQIIYLLKQLEKNSDFVSSLSHISGEEPAIGVICMYAAQQRLLFRKFNEQSWSDTFRGLVKIDTVDSYQGKENRVIIVSTTLNTQDKKPRFLRVLNRVNVAMSRAMDRLIIVGSTDMWKEKNSEYPLGKIASYIQERQGKDYRFVVAKRISTKGRK